MCRKKIRHEELKRIGNKRTAVKSATLTQDYKKNEDQTMDQIDELGAKTSKEEIRTTLRMDLREIAPELIRSPLPDQTSIMRTTIRIMEDQTINARISHSLEAMGSDLRMNFSLIRMETGETVENFPVLHRLKEEISQKINPTANQQVINLTILLSAVMTINIRLVLHSTSKRFYKTITRRHLMCFALSQPTIPLMNYQTFARLTTKVSQLKYRSFLKFKI